MQMQMLRHFCSETLEGPHIHEWKYVAAYIAGSKIIVHAIEYGGKYLD